MRALSRLFRSTLQIMRRIDAAIKTHALYPLKRWLSLQHFTGILLLLYALALLADPSVAVVELGAALRFPVFPTFMGVLFLVCAAFLLGSPINEFRYRVLTLPLLLYFWAVLWYISVTPDTSWMGAISALAIWAFLQIARTDLPPVP